MRANKQEYSCETLEVATGGVVIATPVRLEIGEKVVAYLDLLGGLEAKVARKVVGGYVLSLIATPARKVRLAAQVRELEARLAAPGQQMRRHQRVLTNLCLDLEWRGARKLYRCLNISASGALIESEHLLPIGAEVAVGGLQAHVVRHEPRGFAVEFEEPLGSLDRAMKIGVDSGA